MKNSWKRKGIEVSYRGLYQRYKCNAKTYKRKFDLTFEIFKFLISNTCSYCNSLPNTKYNPYLKTNGDFKQLGRFMDKTYVDTLTITYNGIDRKDSNLGYTLLNSVTCCWTCNQLKKDLFSYEEFKVMMNALIEHRGKK